MNKDKIISEFNLKPFGSKGWMRGKIFCPDCGRNDKFGILFLDDGGVARCFYCQTPLPLFRVLKSMGRDDLLEFDFEFKGRVELGSLIPDPIVEEEKKVELPLGFRHIHYDKYLEDRGFTVDQYDQFGVGVAELDPRTENKLVFKIYQKKRLSGWLARSRFSKEWHHENLRKHKEENGILVLRYRNSENDFNKMLGGLDEITPQTRVVILVEGLFDKANIDRLMGLNSEESVKCCYTFGSDLSVDQVDLIPSTVTHILLMYDAGTINNIREAGSRLISLFDVKVALIKEEGVDPGNISSEKLTELLDNLTDFLYFYRKVLNTIA